MSPGSASSVRRLWATRAGCGPLDVLCVDQLDGSVDTAPQRVAWEAKAKRDGDFFNLTLPQRQSSVHLDLKRKA